MTPSEAMDVINVLVDNWEELPYPGDEAVVRAASVLHQSGMTGTLPGRYGRTVRDIFEAVLAGDMECQDDVTIERRG